MDNKTKEIYETIRGCSMTVAIRVVANDDPDYMKYIQFHEEMMDELKKSSKLKLKKTDE
jgi:hypothetical protein